MTPIRHGLVPTVDPKSALALLGFGTAQAPQNEVSSLRASLRTPARDPFTPAFLKHSDEQTVLSLAAVLDAIRKHRLTEHALDQWAVLAAPRFLGRIVTAASIQRFRQEGAWGIPPHTIPHRSLHSVSGTISQALKIRGPNFGVSGGPNGAAEALLVATALLSDGKLPGVLVVLSGWNPELIPARPELPVSTNTAPPVCSAVALALGPCAPDRRGSQFRIMPNSMASSREADQTVFSFDSLIDTFERDRFPHMAWHLPSGGRVEVTNVKNAGEHLT